MSEIREPGAEREGGRLELPGPATYQAGDSSTPVRRAGRWHNLLAALTAFGIAVVVTGILHWPLPLHLSSWHVITRFGDSHVWCFDQMDRMVLGDLPWSIWTNRAGFPRTLQARFIGYAPALLALPFRQVLGPLAAYNIVLLLSPGLAALAAWAFIRKATDAGAFTAAAASLIYALAPYVLACLTNGQIEKVQHWVYPLHLLLIWHFVDGPRRWSALLLIPLTSLAMVFTDPYYGLFLAIIAVPLAFGRVLAARAQGRSRVVAALLATVALGLTAASMAPVQHYHPTVRPRSTTTLFLPAGPPRTHQGRIDEPQSPVAQPAETFLGQRASSTGPGGVIHVTYLVLPVLLAAIALSFLRFRGRASGVTLLLVGVVLAFGPQLVMNNIYMEFRGRPYYLPAHLLELVNYPLVLGGQYYRAIILASLGMAVIVAGGSSCLDQRAARRPGSPRSRAPFLRAEGWVWVLALVAMIDGIRETGPFWPLPVGPVTGIETLKLLAEDPFPGAVLALPLRGTNEDGGYHMLWAATHGRPTSALPRITHGNLPWEEYPWLRDWYTLLSGKRDVTPARYLRDQGFRYVVLDPVYKDAEKDLGLSRDSLNRLLGAPMKTQGLLVWNLGPVDARHLKARPTSP